MDMSKILRTKKLLSESETPETNSGDDIRTKLQSIHDELKNVVEGNEGSDFDAMEIHKSLMGLASQKENEDYKMDLQNLARFVVSSQFDVAYDLIGDMVKDMDKMSGSTWFNDKDKESSMWAKDEMDFPSEKHFEESLDNILALSGQKKIDEATFERVSDENPMEVDPEAQARQRQIQWNRNPSHNICNYCQDYGIVCDACGGSPDECDCENPKLVNCPDHVDEEDVMESTSEAKHSGGTKHDAVIDLWDGHGKTPAQIAKQLKMDIEKVKGHIAKFKKRTKEISESKEENFEVNESEFNMTQTNPVGNATNASATAASGPDNFSINTYLNMNNGVEDFNVTINASNGKADELLEILRLSGLGGGADVPTPEAEVVGSEMMTEPVPAAEVEVVDAEPTSPSAGDEYGFGYGVEDSYTSDDTESSIDAEEEENEAEIAEEEYEEEEEETDQVNESRDAKYVITVTFDMFAGHPVTRFYGAKEGQEQLVGEKENATVYDDIEDAREQAVKVKNHLNNDQDWQDAKVAIKPLAYLVSHWNQLP